MINIIPKLNKFLIVKSMSFIFFLLNSTFNSFKSFNRIGAEGARHLSAGIANLD